MKKETPKEKKSFLRYMHYFRAFAIINVVLVHTLTLNDTFGYSFKSIDLTFKSTTVIFQSATIYFLFIAGFLFHYLSGRFKTTTFFKNKIKYVILPYIILTIVYSFILYVLVLHPKGMEYFPLDTLLENLIFGKANSHFWYIPFVCVVYIISPFLLLLTDKNFKIITIISFIVPLIFSRTGVELTIYQFLHFIPIYILGMSMSKYFPAYIKMITKHKFSLLLITIASTITLFMIEESTYHLTSFLDIYDSIQYIQKTSITFLIVYFFFNIYTKQSKLLDLFGTYSFGIYFLHGFVKLVIFKIFHTKTIFSYLNDITIVLFIIILAVLILFISLGVSIITKKIFRNYSRYIIGV